jgi:hypothetical protein
MLKCLETLLDLAEIATRGGEILPGVSAQSEDCIRRVVVVRKTVGDDTCMLAQHQREQRLVHHLPARLRAQQPHHSAGVEHLPVQHTRSGELILRRQHRPEQLLGLLILACTLVFELLQRGGERGSRPHRPPGPVVAQLVRKIAELRDLRGALLATVDVRGDPRIADLGRVPGVGDQQELVDVFRGITQSTPTFEICS